MSDSGWFSSYRKSFTLHFDGSHNNQANEGGAGCIIRDNQGELVVAAAYNLKYVCDVATAEAVALMNGLQLAKENNVSLSLIKGDNKEVIDHVLGYTRPSKQHLSGIIQQIVEMFTYPKPEIELINREENKAADKLASWGYNRFPRGGSQIFKAYAELPPQVAELVKQEMLGSISKNENEGEGSSVFGSLAKVGAAVAGVAMIAMELSKK